MNNLNVPKQPMKTVDAANRRFTVRFRDVGEKDSVEATVYGHDVNAKVSVPVEAPVLNWGWYARQALKLALQKTFGITPTKTEEDSNDRANV